SVDAGLCGRNMKLHRRAEVMQRCANVEDLPAMLLELCKCRATDIEGTFQIDVDDCSEPVRGKLFSFAKEVACGAVHDDVDTAEPIDGGGNSLFNFFRVADIGGDSERFPMERGHPCPHSARRALVVDC